MAGLSKKQLKVLEELTRRADACREFMNDWLLFNQILSAYPNPNANKAQLESEFLKIKSKLARGHRVLKETLASDYMIDGNIMNIVAAATNLQSIHGQSEVAVKKAQAEWHRAFISINETLGVVEDKKKRAEAGEKISLGPTVAGGAGGGGGMSPQVKKTLLIVGGMILLIIILMNNPVTGPMYKDALVSFGIGKR